MDRHFIWIPPTLSGTGLNTQHWRFILVDNKQNLKTLAEDSTSGSWVRGANFAIIVLTNAEYSFHLIDAGRVAQNMQLAAWNHKVGSGLFTGIRVEKFRSDFESHLQWNKVLLTAQLLLEETQV